MKFVEIKSPISGASAYRYGGLTIFIEDHNGMIHLSLSHPSRIPKWEEIKTVKYHFLPMISMVMYFPKIGDYVNVHPFCLHLYSEE